jgi:spore germination cell wall hydrolase CwlJ-like protein
MNSTMKKATCRALVISLLALSFQSARAGLIGAEQAAPSSASTERSLLLSTLDRAEVAAQLQAAGVDPNAARTRVATMSDQEVQAMAQDIQAAPAGAMSTAGWVAVVLIAGLIWYFAFRK